MILCLIEPFIRHDIVITERVKSNKNIDKEIIIIAGSIKGVRSG